jgi:glycosyltransferase involved in cell wall biosynthesis
MQPAKQITARSSGRSFIWNFGSEILWTTEMLKQKDILYLTHNYTDFIKNQIEKIAGHFRNVTVLARYKPLAELSRIIPFSKAYGHTFKQQFDLASLPSNVSVIPVPLWYFPSDYFYRRLGEQHFSKVLAQVRKTGIHFDIIHAHFVHSAGYAAMKLAEASGKPFVLTGHGEDVYDIPFRSDFWKQHSLKILKAADALITVSPSNVASLRDMGFNGGVEIIPNGFLPALFHPENTSECRADLNLPADKKILFSAGFFGEVKGHRYLIQAMQKLCENRDDLVCVIAGDGELRHEYRRMISDAGLSKYIMLTGRIAHRALGKWMNACDLFVMPSLRESFGVAQLEAMACGKPVVATVNGGSEHILKQGVSGMLCPAADATALSATIATALNTTWNTHAIAEEAKKYSWDKISEDICRVYKKIIKQ